MTVGLTGLGSTSAAGAVTVQASVAWYLSWAECAIDHFEAARRERADMQRSSTPWLQLSKEFQASALTITVCAFALEALQMELAPIVVLEDVGRRWSAKRTSAASRAHQTLSLACSIPNGLSREIDWLFDLRGQAAHPASKMAPTALHPGMPSNVAEPHATYVVEAAGRALRLLAVVFDRLASAPRKVVATWVIGWQSGLISTVARIDGALSESRSTTAAVGPSPGDDKPMAP